MPLIENPEEMGLHPQFAESAYSCSYKADLYGRVMDLMAAMVADDECTMQDVLRSLSEIAQRLAHELEDTRADVPEKPRTVVTALHGAR